MVGAALPLDRAHVRARARDSFRRRARRRRARGHFAGARNAARLPRRRYAFAQRSDAACVDEPLYAHHLRLHPALFRPYREQLLRAQCPDGAAVARALLLAPPAAGLAALPRAPPPPPPPEPSCRFPGSHDEYLRSLPQEAKDQIVREADEQYEDAKRFGGPVLRQDIFEDVVETYARHHPRAVAALSAPRAPPSLVYLKHMAKQAGGARRGRASRG